MRLAELVRKMCHTGPQGYRVNFEWRKGSMLHGDMTPERDEEPFAREEDAWQFAAHMANRLGAAQVCNIYVIDAVTYKPVDGYRERMYFPR